MSSFALNQNCYLQFLPHQNCHFSTKETDESINFLEYSPSPKLPPKSGKKLNFEDNEVIVSEFNCATEPFENFEGHPQNSKNLMEIEEESSTPQYNTELQRENSLQTPQKMQKNLFPFLQVTVPPKYSKKEFEFQEPQPKTNHNIIGYPKYYLNLKLTVLYY